MNRGRMLAQPLSVLLGMGLAALGCGSDMLHGKDGGRGGSGGTGAADGGIDGGGCRSDLVVDWQIQSATGAAVTCDAIHAAEVVVDIDGASYPQACSSGLSSGGQDILLQMNYAAYQVTVNLVDVSGNVLAVPQATTIAVASCGSYRTPGPAILVVAASAQ